MKRILILTLFALACGEQKVSSTDTMATSTTQTTTSGTTSTTSTGSSGGTISSLTAEDKEFVIKAAQGGMSEVGLGQMASEKATSTDVKNFANRMVNDHGQANDELAKLAKNKGLALPTELNGEQNKMADELSKKVGRDFDKAYMTEMIRDHETDVAEFEKMSKDARDPDLKAWVTKTLPTLQDHLRVAKQTAK